MISRESINDSTTDLTKNPSFEEKNNSSEEKEATRKDRSQSTSEIDVKITLEEAEKVLESDDESDSDDDV